MALNLRQAGPFRCWMLWYFNLLAKRYRSWIAGAFVLAIALHAVRSRAAATVRVPKAVGFAAAQHAAYMAEAADAARSSEAARSKSAGMNPERRLQWLRQCVKEPKCRSWQVDAIIDGAPADEQRRALIVSLAAAAEDAATTASDGDIDTVQIARIAGIVSRPGMGLSLLGEMRPTTLVAAQRDPDGARGRALKVSGRIVELRTTYGLAEGLLLTDDKTLIRFATSMPTTGLRASAAFTFRGVFVQRHLYKSSTGARMRALVVVGAFETAGGR